LDSPSHYCKGYGLEVGASDCPYPFAKSKMDYADLFNELRSEYLNKNGFIPLMSPKCLLDSVDSNRYDFVYASHVLEHSVNPLGTLQDWVRVLRQGGVVYVVLPNKNQIYDKHRDATPLRVLIDKFERDIWIATMDEVVEMVNKTSGLPNYEVEECHLKNLYTTIKNHPDGTHHYSVFDPQQSLEFIGLASRLFNLQLINFQIIRHEIHIVLTKNFS
jgi:SAM-dependent methyltransferase